MIESLELSSVGPSVAIHVGDRVRSGFGFGRASRNLVLVFVFSVSIYRPRGTPIIVFVF